MLHVHFKTTGSDDIFIASQPRGESALSWFVWICPSGALIANTPH
jgi:hypothetical protein